MRFGDYQDQILLNSFSQMRLVTGRLSMSLAMGALLLLTLKLVQPGFLTDRVLFVVLVAVPFDGQVSVLFAVHIFAVLLAVLFTNTRVPNAMTRQMTLIFQIRVCMVKPT